jgi:hypothetical protein
MGVAGQVLEHLLGPAEGRLGVDDPVVFDRGVEQSMNWRSSSAPISLPLRVRV